jgi:hypothetical protein
MEEKEEEEEDKETEKSIELYDNDIIFVFHNHSDATKKPGKGTGEKIPVLKISDFAALHNENNWRQKIDDDWTTAFTLDHLRWGSVSHYLLALPFRKSEPDIFKEFSLDGTDEKIAKNIDLANQMIEKTKGKEGKFYAKYKIVSKSGELGEDEIAEAEIEKMKGTGVKMPNATESRNIKNNRKSIVLEHSVFKGQKINQKIISIKRPGWGIEPKHFKKILGKNYPLNPSMNIKKLNQILND